MIKSDAKESDELSAKSSIFLDSNAEKPWG